MPAPHLSILLLSRQLFLLVPIEMVLDALRNDLFYLSLALGWVRYRFLRHHAQIVGHSHASLWSWSEAERNLLLAVTLLLKALFAAKLLLLLLSEVEWNHNILILLDLFVTKRHWVLYEVRDSVSEDVTLFELAFEAMLGLLFVHFCFSSSRLRRNEKLIPPL